MNHAIKFCVKKWCVHSLSTLKVEHANQIVMLRSGSVGDELWFVTVVVWTFVLAGCSTKEKFSKKQAAGELNMPLLWLSKSVRTKDGASQPVAHVNHTVETVESVSWAALSAPNAAYTHVLGVLNDCPEHDEGTLFAFLADIQPDPYHGMRVVYDGQEGPRGLYLAALVACNSKSKTEKVGDDGCKIVTSNVKDVGTPRWNCRQAHTG